MAVIRVGGNLGAGKTTLCKKLAEHLGYVYIYAGGIFREMAKEKGLTIEEFYSKLASSPEVEKSVDTHQTNLMKSQDHLIVEGRISAFLPCSFKAINLFFKVNEEEGARRMLNRPENQGRSLEEMLALSRQRATDERVRYKSLYNIEDHLDEKKYDIVIDTTGMSPEEVLSATIKAVEPLIR